MKEKKEKFLPIGSIVLLKGATKKVMITSYLMYIIVSKLEKILIKY